jgi:hypothetical protein
MGHSFFMGHNADAAPAAAAPAVAAAAAAAAAAVAAVAAARPRFFLLLRVLRLLDYLNRFYISFKYCSYTFEFF